MKKKWSDINIREFLNNLAKYLILTITSILGFWLIYFIIWLEAGLPQTSLAMWILFALAMVSERLFIWWLNY